MDLDGYPESDDLDRISHWNENDPHGLIKFITRLWWPGDGYGVQLRGRVLSLHTYGWSGNESIISALQDNLFWVFYWEKSFRGGHYWFRLNTTTSDKP